MVSDEWLGRMVYRGMADFHYQDFVSRESDLGPSTRMAALGEILYHSERHGS